MIGYATSKWGNQNTCCTNNPHETCHICTQAKGLV
jgi:hypothetical protein